LREEGKAVRPLLPSQSARWIRSYTEEGKNFPWRKKVTGIGVVEYVGRFVRAENKE